MVHGYESALHYNGRYDAWSGTKILLAVQCRQKVKQQQKSRSTNLENAEHISDRELISGIHKNYYNSIRRQTEAKFFAWAKDLKRHFTKKIEEWPLISMKTC